MIRTQVRAARRFLPRFALAMALPLSAAAPLLYGADPRLLTRRRAGCRPGASRNAQASYEQKESQAGRAKTAAPDAAPDAPAPDAAPAAPAAPDAPAAAPDSTTAP